ncbi:MULTISPECIES: DEAD/DEAH box helicase family protein [unclassified Caballeronia]|uniref:DEAD/DEAH box helicase family protein n=1 Tax=unclassified Caballeronia TaxID=2646786 RepID=UPI0020280C8D|nr:MULTISPECIES: DEAD/DEAH box helicase family protein [unclassified Caballeronia]
MNDKPTHQSVAFLREQHFWSRSRAAQILDLSGGDPDLGSLGESQLRGALALHSMLLRHGTAYLADEVGMGKTYVALAVIALLRCYKPDLRVLYVTPSRNVREKWARRECAAMNRLLDRQLSKSLDASRQPKSFRHGWAFTPREASTVLDLVSAHDPARKDVFISYSAFSFQLDDDVSKWAKSLKNWPGADQWSGIADKSAMKEAVARCTYEKIREHGYDLLVFDEAHLLRSTSSDRARFIKLALRGPEHEPVYRGALLLSATPFDRDLGQLRAQLAIAEPRAGQLLDRLHGLKPRDENGSRDWSDVQRALAIFMVRRSHALGCGDGQARSRNQYRVEYRRAAAIGLRQPAAPESLQERSDRLLQRLYTAVVQKRLVESEEATTFPLAMFSSWESYSPRRSTGAAKEPATEMLDVRGDAANSGAELSKDASLLTALSESWCKRFPHDEPPHPKLEREARRIAQAAFGAGEKQLVFVRRIRSISDLKARIDGAYDAWLAGMLYPETGVPQETWRCFGRDRKPRAAEESVAARTTAPDGRDEVLPASFENLFCWFFRGKTDKAGERLADASGRPTPERLREELTTQTNWRSLLGESDWRRLLKDWLGDIDQDQYGELARIASEFSRTSQRTRLDNFRQLQIAWLIMRQRAWPEDSLQGKACSLLIAWSAKAYASGDNHGLAEIDTAIARDTLGAPTLMSGFGAHDGLLDALWPLCTTLLGALREGRADEDLLAEFDLYREVLFAVTRLDHPFIDLWLSCSTGSESDRRLAVEEQVRSFSQRVAAQSKDRESFNSYRVFRQLAQGWTYLRKTNLSDIGTSVDRQAWRRAIAQRITSLEPVEWASGQNAVSRPDIAWRFRMPGYPMVLVSTSVFQEGEDLHTYCRHVTHFGISGSPIGIEQKNGRVDRVGSQSQRLLNERFAASDDALRDRGIGIRFPHVTESLEWLQIRDLSMRLNDYQRSLHRMEEIREQDSPDMKTALLDNNDIPEQLSDALTSPFEPRLATWQEI